MAFIFRSTTFFLFVVGLTVEATASASWGVLVAPRSTEFLHSKVSRHSVAAKDSDIMKEGPITCKTGDFDSFDENGDEHLDHTELADAFAKWLLSRDPDLSVIRSADHASEMFKERVGAMITSVDLDADGTLSRKEFETLRQHRKAAKANATSFLFYSSANSTSSANSSGSPGSDAEAGPTCKKLCQEYSKDETYQRECITDCRVNVDLSDDKADSIRTFALTHSPAAQEAYEEAFDETMRECVPAFGADHFELIPQDFDQVDFDHDGSISRFEALTLGRALCIPWSKMLSIIKKGDVDKDGKLCKKEWSNVGERFVIMFAIDRFAEMCLDDDFVPVYGNFEVVNGTNGTNGTDFTTTPIPTEPEGLKPSAEETSANGTKNGDEAAKKAGEPAKEEAKQ